MIDLIKFRVREMLGGRICLGVIVFPEKAITARQHLINNMGWIGRTNAVNHDEEDDETTNRRLKDCQKEDD